MINHTDRLGYYLVGWKKFYNKTLALMEHRRTGYEVIWKFNDEVYSAMDWTAPIPYSLTELYKKRAQQLREKYDYLVLLYSGGADSSQVLCSFIDNGIFLDEIVMQQPAVCKPNSNNQDKSNVNNWSEIDYSAVPFLNQHKNKIDPRTKVKYHDFSTAGIELLEKDNWVESSYIGMSFNVSAVLRQISFSRDSSLLSLYDKGKNIAFVMGIDKPLVYFDGQDYYSYFMDTSAYHVTAPVDFNDEGKTDKNYCTEFFYWSPDMPEIVVKQAQDIKLNCELNPYAKMMASKILKTHISEYRDVLHPVIYEKQIIIDFTTEKPSTKLYRPMDRWFWDTTSKKVQDNYLNVLNHYRDSIDSKFGIDGEVFNGLSAFRSKFYKL